MNILRKEHFESIHVQMKCKEEGKITIKDIPNLMFLPEYKGHNTTSKYFRDCKTHLSQHYGVKCFPLNHVIWSTLSASSWMKAMDHSTMSKGSFSYFFNFKEVYCEGCRFADILSQEATIPLVTTDKKVLA